MSELPEKFCEECGEEFVPRSRTHVMCSAKCRSLRRKRASETCRTGTCLNCGGDFSGGRSDRVYCSHACGTNFRNRRWYRNKKGEIVRRRRAVHLDMSQYQRWKKLKSNALRRGITFTLTLQDMPEIPDVCPVLGIPMDLSGGTGFLAGRPTIDRIDPCKGYTPGNVRCISARANLLKSDATLEEIELVLKDLQRIRYA